MMSPVVLTSLITQHNNPKWGNWVIGVKIDAGRNFTFSNAIQQSKIGKLGKQEQNRESKYETLPKMWPNNSPKGGGNKCFNFLREETGMPH